MNLLGYSIELRVNCVWEEGMYSYVFCSALHEFVCMKII